MAASPPVATPERIPSLDGLRAFSIGLVLVGHARDVSGWPRLPVVDRLGDFANLGVRVFFVISGFLITTLLAAELRKTGTVSLRQFYLRRTLRIFPAFYVLIAATAAAAALGWITLRPFDVTAALTYTTNYHRDRAWYLGHTWSLAVEEQFYLLWPLAVKVLGIGRAMTAAAMVMLLAPIVRVGTGLLVPSAAFGIGETFPTVADAIAAGCLLAGLRARLEANQRYARFLRSPAFWLIPALVFAASLIPFFKLTWLVGETVMNVGIALVVHAFVQFRTGWAWRVLNLRAVSAIGVLSYSLYLWQQPFLFPRGTAAVNRFPLALACLLGAALASHFFVERPFLALRQRLERWIWR